MKTQLTAGQIVVLDEIPIRFDIGEAKAALHWREGRDSESELAGLLEKARSLISARAAFRASPVGLTVGDEVAVGDVTFRSRVLRINLTKVKTVFPYLLTIGKSLEAEAQASGDLLRQYYLESLGDLALHLAEEYLAGHLRRTHRIKRLVNMNPGSLEDWPLTEQKSLFSLFGDTEKLLGIRLTAQMLMLPRKSVSGVYFSSATGFSSCKLCRREKCQGRKAAFDPALSLIYGRDGESGPSGGKCFL